MDPNESPILFYDGACGLCARSVVWCLDHDRRGKLRFAPLQGETYARVDSAEKPRGLETVVLLEGGVLRTRSDALLGMLRNVGGVWAVLAVCAGIVPRVVRDGVYRFVARRRHAWHGVQDGCRVPSSVERERFLA